MDFSIIFDFYEIYFRARTIKVFFKPWSPNYSTIERPQRLLHPSQRVYHTKFVFATSSVAQIGEIWGLCPTGSMKHCHHLFSLSLGMYRCMRRGELGCWYQHEVRDSRRNQKKYS
ncbi:hypothetical protein L5515_010559 [Caenorhabditis briggsae]|uniref:Uncharacterized protein n=1 Tax=Caenorhabditis briggsae TaxID=6238 RepID=A0AAE9ERB6_CAEBR|nr:hypothetical protein L5515_010559 [Caenorhabditis briggsae]